jgi:ketosteroid isomerase-like protein
MVQAAVIAVLVALLASLAIWQWRTASGLSSEKGDREDVSTVASAYGDVALNYNAQNYQSQMDKAQKLMGGDLLETFKSTTLPSLGETFKSNPELSLTSKTNQVFVGSVDGKFATAVVMVDIDVKTKDGATSAPATLLRLALAKIDGEWKVTKQYASGANDQNQGQGQLPTAPTGGASPSPNPETSKKPGD